MVAPHEREVIIRLILEPDRAKATQASAEITKVLDAVRKQADVTSKAGSTAVDKAVADQTKAYRKATAEYQRHTQGVRVAQEQMSERFNTLTSDVMKMGRGFTMLGISGEKDMLKLAQGLVKIQATFDLITGAVGTWIRLSRIMRDYATATSAAASAHAALATAQSLSAATGASAAVGGAAGAGHDGGISESVLGGAAGFGGAKTVKAGAAAKVGGIGAGTIAIGTAALASGVAAAITSVQFLADWSKHGLTGGATPGTLSDKIANTEAALAVWASKLLGFDLTGAGATEQMAGKQTARRGRAEVEVQHERTIAGLLRQRQGIVQAMRNEELQRVREIQRVELQGGRERVSQLERARDLQLDAAKRAQQQATGARERFAQLSPQARMRAQRAKQKLAAGQRLTHGEEQALGSFREIGSIDKPLGERFRERAERWGFGDFGGREMDEATRGHQEAARRIQVDLARQSVEVQINYLNQETFIQEIVSQTKRLVDQDREWQRREIARQIEAAWERRDEQIKALNPS